MTNKKEYDQIYHKEKLRRVPFNLNLENAVVPQEQDIYDAIKRTLYL